MVRFNGINTFLHVAFCLVFLMTRIRKLFYWRKIVLLLTDNHTNWSSYHNAVEFVISNSAEQTKAWTGCSSRRNIPHANIKYTLTSLQKNIIIGRNTRDRGGTAVGIKVCTGCDMILLVFWSDVIDLVCSGQYEYFNSESPTGIPASSTPSH